MFLVLGFLLFDEKQLTIIKQPTNNEQQTTNNEQRTTNNNQQPMKKPFTFRDLNVYKEGRELINTIYKISSKFPKDELYGITNQLRRAAVSINLNIAEGSGRSSKGDQKRFYNIAKASLYECIAIFDICSDMKYISTEEFRLLEEKSKSILAKLNGLIKYVKEN